VDGEEPGQADVILAPLAGGSRLAGYRLEERIGAGGMAVVFRARDSRLNRTVALKVLIPALATVEGFRERFLRESRAAAAVDDPHIIPVYEAGEADGVLFIAMRFVAGGDLRAVIRREGPLPAHRAASFISPVASALDAAHAAGLVHRDVKPANILVDTGTDRPDQVYLSDFGLSKAALASVGLTGTGQFLGTPDYSAPEQVSGRAVDGRADQYALACVAFTLLTGQPLFPRDEPMAVLLAHTSEPPVPVSAQRPDLPAATDQVLARALAKAPENRFGSCGEFAEALREALGVASYTAQAAGPAAITGAVTAPELSAAAASTRTPVPVQAAPGRDEMSGNTVPPRRQRRRWYPGVAVAAGVVLILAGGVAAILVNPASHGSPPASTHSTGSGAANRPTPASTARLTRAARLADPGGEGVVSAGFVTGGEIAAIDANGSIYLWDIATGQFAAPLTDPGHQGIATASFGRGGRFAVVAGHTGATYVWEIASHHRTGTLTGLNTRFLLISPEGDTVLTEDANRDGIALTDPTQPTHQLTLPDPDRIDLTAGAALSPDASTLAVNDASGRTYLWDTVTRTMITYWKSPGGVANLAAFSPDGKTLAETAGAGKVYLWDIPSHRLAGTVPIPGGTSLDGMAISPDGKLLAEVSSDSDKVYLRDISTGQQVAVITDPDGNGTTCATFSPDGKTLAIGDNHGSTYLWNIQRE
jgi:tRNA A-37 threonylcarbamoyl transferase component Bud32/sugar lactone lactonase YvrE